MDTAVRMISVAVRNRPGLPGLHVQKRRPEETNKTEPEEIARYLRGCVGPTARLPATGRVGPSGTRPGAPSPPPSSCAGPAGPPSRRRGGVTASALTRASPRQMAVAGERASGVQVADGDADGTLFSWFLV